MLTHLQDTRQFTSPYAPDFFVLGARVRGELVSHLETALYVMGKGMSFSIAQTRMCGEAVERVSIIREGNNKSWRAHNQVTDKWIDVVPDTFFASPWFMRSHGCGAHNHLESASLSAVNELWERRAVQDWWEGKSALRILDPAHPLSDEIGMFIFGARRGAFEQRVTRFGIIEGPYPVNVAVAISYDRNGAQPAIAFAASSGSLSGLFQRAFEELLSVELETADLYRARLDGDEIIKGTNRYLVQERQQVLQIRLARELAEALPITTAQPTLGANGTLLESLQRSSALDCDVWLIDQTHPAIGLPTVRAIFSDPDKYPFGQYDDNTVMPL